MSKKSKSKRAIQQGVDRITRENHSKSDEEKLKKRLEDSSLGGV
jgi:hypothetical protein